MKILKDKRGISLIVLVITIILIIIISGAIILSLNSSGIIERAHKAVDSFNEGAEKERLQVILSSAYKENMLTESGIKEAVDREFGINNSKVKMFDDGAITILLENSKREYYVDSKGQMSVTSVSKIRDTEGLSGAGTEANPYKINSIEDLVEFSANIDTYKTSYVELSRDLDFRSISSYIEYDKVNEETGKTLMDTLTSGEGFNPIRGYNKTFDGKNHTISNLYINRDNDVVALFTSPGSSINMNNLILKGEVSGNNNVAGILAQGYMSTTWPNVFVRNCKSYVNVTGTGSCVSGISSLYAGDVKYTNCSNYGTIKGINSVGGIDWGRADISGCNNYGQIKGETNVGGISAQGSSIYNCANFGEVEGTGYVGGIQGGSANVGVIERCYNKGNIKGTNNVGGIEGWCWRAGRIVCAYNSGSVNGTSYTGGIVGWGITISNCYNIGQVSGLSNVGAVAGYVENINSYSNTYYLNTLTCNKAFGNTADVDGKGQSISPSDLKGASIIATLNASHSHNDVDYTDNCWKLDTNNENNGYPIFK